MQPLHPQAKCALDNPAKSHFQTTIATDWLALGLFVPATKYPF